MFTPSLEDTRSELREKTNRLVVERLRPALWMMLCAIALFALSELRLSRAEIVPLYLVKLVQVVTVVTVLRILAAPRLWTRAVPIAVCAVSVLCVTAAASNILRNDIALTPLLFIMLTMGSATLFPWGLAPQLVTVAVAALAIVGNVYLVTGSLTALVGYPALAVAIALTGSLYVAYEVDRYRVAIEQRNLALRGYQDIVENANDMMYTQDLDGNLTSVNRVVERITGYTREEVLKMNLATVVAPDSREREQLMRPRDLPADVPFVYELEIIAKDGHRVAIEVSSRLVVQDGRPVGVHGAARDITERKRAEAELQRAKDAAEAASRAKSEFLANVSHEIRTPMNGIIGMTELALNTDLTTEQGEYLSMVQASAESLLTVINDILDFSKIEAGKLDLDLIPFNLRDSLFNTTKALAVRAHQKGLELACHIAPDVPDALVGDPIRLRQILLNLVNNAIKFTEHGEVVVEVHSSNVDKDTLHFLIRDTGIGIAAEKQQAIFNPFEQADGSTTRRYGGTGLGLAISSKLVEMLGGQIWVESAPGCGSAFHFTARFSRQQYPVLRSPAAPPLRLHGLPVLVVDDNTTNRRILQEMLANWRMRSTAVDGGAAALAAMQRAVIGGEPFPLVLLDAHMPKMDGFAVAAQIRSNPELAGATIMMLSSAGQPGDAIRCRELGVAAYLTKPIKQSELLQTILDVLDTPPAGEARSSLTHAESSADGWRALRILVAEDNAVNQELARRMLQKRGHTVVVAGNGAEALAALKTQPFDLVLMDVQMPDMDGFEATVAIRRRESQLSLPHVPIVALTAHAMKGDQERCLAAGMDAYVSKPIQAKTLFEAIESATAAASERSPGNEEAVSKGTAGRIALG